MSVEAQKPSPGSPRGRRLALVIGVNGPPALGRASLRYAGDDGRDMARVLQQDCCGFELFRPALLGEQATTAQVKNAVIKLAKGIQSDDSILFFFSGHAEALPIGADLDDVYLVTDDFDKEDIEFDKDSHVSLRWLRQVLFEHKKASSVLLILDCCYAGKFAESAPDLYFETLRKRLLSYFDTPGAQSPSRPGGVRLALTASGNGVAKEQDGHGLLTDHILQALRGDCEQAANDRGEITFTSLFGYLDAAMPGQSPRFFGAGAALLLATHPHLSAQLRREREQAAQQAERERRLHALAADPGGFLNDRLESFVGRELELERVRQYVQELLPTGGYLAITGVAGQGKSSLIARLVQEAAQERGGIEQVVYHFIPSTPGAEYQAVLLRKLMARLVLKHQLSDVFLEEHASTATLSAGFHWMLSTLAEQGKQEIIFIDGLDQLRPDQQTGWRDLSFLPQGPDLPPPGIVFVLGTRPDDTRRPLESLKPFQEYPLPGLSRPDFDRVLRHRNVTTLETSLVSRLHEILEENALYLDLVAKELAARPSITPQEVEQIVQQVADNPEHLFSLSIERLRWQRDLWEAVTKPVLGLLSVAREPLSRDHLKRLLNLNSTRQVDGEQLNLGLQGLGGLIGLDNQQRYSLFHLKLRDYLLQDKQQPQKEYLFDLEDQRQQHGRFVAWCEQHGLDEIWKDTALDLAEQERRRYARQHYITHLYEAEAGQWKQLFKVLDEGRYGKAKLASDPSTRQYALDLDLGRQAAASSHWSQRQAIQHLPHLWRYTLLRSSLASRADQYPAEAFKAMLVLGYEQRAIGLAELLTEPAYQASIFLLIARHLSSSPERKREAQQMFLRAEQVSATIANKWERAGALSALAGALAQGEHWAEAKRLWQEAERVSATIAIEWERARALSALAVALAQGKQWAEAQRVSATIADGWARAGALSELAGSLAQAGQWAEAKRLWQEVERVSATIADERERARALSELAVSLAQAGQWAEAQRVSATIANKRERARALSELAVSLAQAEQWEEAKRLWQEAERVSATLADERERARALSELAVSLAQAGQWAEAQRVSATLANERERAGALRELAVSLAQAGQWAEAQRVSATLADERERAWALRELAVSLAQAGQWAEAKRLWQEAQRVSALIPIERERAWALRELAVSLAQAGQWAEAQRVSATIANKWERAWALRELAGALAQHHKDGEVVRLIGRQWSRTTRRDEALRLLPLALVLLPRYPELGPALFDAFAWVDGFLQPSSPSDDPQEEYQEGA